MSTDSITVVSANDKPEVAPKEDAASVKVDETKSASSQVQDEKVEASDASKEESEKDSEGQEDATDHDEESEEEAKEDSEKPKKKNGFKKRIDKLSKRASTAEQERDYWKQEALKSQKPTETKTQTQTLDASDKPKAESYETHAEFVEALTDWKVEQKEKSLEAKKKEESAKSEYQKTVESFQSKVKDYKEQHDDFDDALENVDDIPMSVALQELFLHSENGPELMHELAKQRKEYERINSLAPLAAAREFGKFEAQFLSKEETKQAEKKTTKAPAPLSTVGKSSSGVKKTIYTPGLSQSEYEALRAEQLKARRA